MKTKLQWPSGVRHHYLAELFSHVTVVGFKLLFVIYYYLDNFKLWHNNKLTNYKRLPSNFCTCVLIVSEQDFSYVNEWKY
jgi:hypothetical protein